MASSAIRCAINDNAYRKEHRINLIDEAFSSDGINSNENPAYFPIESLGSPAIKDSMRNVLQGHGFTSPTPIQAQTWPIALSGRDVIAVARTGSGKTFGFLLPALQMSFDNNATRSAGYRSVLPKVLVMAPTRELSVQIATEAEKLARPNRLMVNCVYGGTNRAQQISKLKMGSDIIVGTPGRINDLIDSGYLDVNEIKFLVLDEADRMLDMGFEPQISSIVEKLPRQRQTVFYTATWPKEVKSLALKYLKNPLRVVVGDPDVLNANKNIKQHVMIVKESEKMNTLMEIVEGLTPQGTANNAVPKTLIFASTKASCEDTADYLINQGYAAKALHGDKSQRIRDAIVHQFRTGMTNVVVATDVAARGLDIKDIEIVINVDFPSDGVESYVHRIGRTGRGENPGNSITFFSPANAAYARDLIELLERSEQPVPQELIAMTKNPPTSSSQKYSRFGNGQSKSGSFGGNNRYGNRGGGYSRGGYGDNDNHGGYGTSSYGEGNSNSYGGRNSYGGGNGYGGRNNYGNNGGGNNYGRNNNYGNNGGGFSRGGGYSGNRAYGQGDDNDGFDNSYASRNPRRGRMDADSFESDESGYGGTRY